MGDINLDWKDGFIAGTFVAIEYLVVTRDEPGLAEEIAKQAGLSKRRLRLEAERTGYHTQQMKQFIRECRSLKK